ncbi:tripartite tricarboxylate transporter permease [Halomonas sp.]|uniref:tripartite tricarboxylate transporter permease n=1 Tax=Halomonas sp. TaxID=1486246 RepID=UPI003A8EDA3E
MFDIFLVSLTELISPFNLLLIMGACVLGLVVGSLPGLNAAMAVAIMLPLTFSFSPGVGLAVMIAVYIGGLSGGMVSAVLLNMPGTPSSIATTFEGYPMAQRGEAVKALGTCALASCAGGMISLLMLILFAPVISSVAIKLGPAEYFSLSVMALTLVIALSRGSIVKGLLAGLLGLLMGTVGFAPVDGTARFTFGSISMMAGLGIIPVMIGLFAISQVLRDVYENKELPRIDLNIKGMGVTLREVRENVVNVIRSSLIGVGIGVLPGIGGTASNMIAYGVAQQSSRTPEKFGKGTVEGLWATESANNASVGGALLPLITLGIPGDGVTAILIGAFMIHGLQPGPLLFANNPDIISSVYAAFMLSVFFVVVFQLLTLKIFPRVLRIPQNYMLPVLVVLSVIGAYASDFRLFDVWVMLMVGVAAVAIGLARLPVGPLVLGFVLGPIVETNLRRSLMHSDGAVDIFFTQPISASFLAIGVMVVVLSLFPDLLKRVIPARWRRGKSE